MPNRPGMPKSELVARTLEREIREGRVGHGEQLESAGELMRRFSVSRNTVRRGLEILTQQGLITTRTGIGSFVTYDGTTIDSNLGWTVALSSGTGTVETHVLAFERGTSDDADKRLDTDKGDYLCLDRLRFCNSDKKGISLERSRLPWRPEFKPLLDAGLSGGSLNQTLSELGLASASGQEVAGVIPALSDNDAAQMKREPGTPMLRLERVTRCANGSVLEYVESILDPDRFGLRIDF